MYGATLSRMCSSDPQGLYNKYRGQGFTVIGAPCDQFGGQEPGSEAQAGVVWTSLPGVVMEPLYCHTDQWSTGCGWRRVKYVLRELHG
jgi:hypothetical protein